MPTTGEVLVRFLEANGIRVVFGIPGVHTVELYRGLPETGLRHVTPRHEQGAGFMADGYARVTGKPAACFVVTGPGVTNILTAMGQAYGDSMPMLVISSVTRTNHLGMGQGRLHELPSQRNMAAGVTAFSHTLLSPDQLPEVLARAFALFCCSRPRPIHLEIPVDVIRADASHVEVRKLPTVGPPAPSPARIARAAELLRFAERPLLVLGGGAVEAGEPALALIELLRAPFINTVNAKGVIPPNHPLHMGENFSFAPLRQALKEADVVLAVGTEFGETEMYPDPQELQFDGQLIRVDIDPEQTMRVRPADVPIVADARLTLDALLYALKATTIAKGGRIRAGAVREAVQALWWPSIQGHRRVLDAVDRALPDAIIAGDQTQPVYGGNQFHAPARPRSWFNASTGYGTLGYALPAAMGAKLAAPDRPVVALIGDGGFQFTLPELASAVEAQVPIVILLWNNRGYGEIKTYMAETGVPPIGVDLVTPDFVAIARGFGCVAGRAESIEHLEELLRASAGRSVPTLVEIDEDAPYLA
ncbi:MAG TPA: 5-guanidino-2-oxopentanoate decarboxylase [Geminicoccus sp.]|jgi:acetolactate synthase-1/2/3 large subunit|uniref:5-guanidino-2-oxopentanoate decarboxylase n=1 Tax=Geminicoccus sp. TaxID=2024832 RepID=UPI002E341BF4|nr:5-guanidino-2-oxopentanoate decarboxylase [Geminicoccus sp.]HEX2527010.1 5-guanidino-2-oxopentanoate decarboxylase [Geminicoccus sp.]